MPDSIQKFESRKTRSCFVTTPTFSELRRRQVNPTQQRRNRAVARVEYTCYTQR